MLGLEGYLEHNEYSARVSIVMTYHNLMARLCNTRAPDG